jgi:hypothetical protein
MSKKFEYGTEHDTDSESHDQTQTQTQAKSGAKKEDRGRDEKVIHTLETQMASSIHKLNTKISQLDAEPASSSATRVTVGIRVAAVALIAAIMQLL